MTELVGEAPAEAWDGPETGKGWDWGGLISLLGEGIEVWGAGSIWDMLGSSSGEGSRGAGGGGGCGNWGGGGLGALLKVERLEGERSPGGGAALRGAFPVPLATAGGELDMGGSDGGGGPEAAVPAHCGNLVKP